MRCVPRDIRRPGWATRTRSASASSWRPDCWSVNAAGVQGVEHLGLQGERPIEMLQRRLATAELQQRHAELGVGPRDPGLEGHLACISASAASAWRPIPFRAWPRLA